MTNAAKISNAEFQSNLRESMKAFTAELVRGEGKWTANMKLWGHKQRKQYSAAEN